MPRPHTNELLHLVIQDEDRSLFTVVGPMADDTPWIERVCAAQKTGRCVRCSSAGRGQTRESIIRSAREELGFEYTDEVFV